MKIKVEELIKALEIVKPGLSNKEVVEQATSFAFMEDRVVTYNDEISVSHPVSNLGIRGAVKADELYQLISRVKKDEIDVEITENEVLLKSGRAKAGLTLMTDIRLPLDELGELGKWEKLPGNFLDALSFVKGACSTDDTRPVLTCVYVSSKRAEATDSFRVAQHNFDGEMEACPFLLPAAAAREVIKIKPSEIAAGNGWIHFRTEAGTVISCRVFTDKFVDADPHFELQDPVQFNLPKTLPEVLDRAAVFSKRETMMEETVTVEAKKNRMMVSCKSDYGWFTEEINVKYDHDPIKFHVTPALLKDILKVTEECSVDGNRIVFQSEVWRYLAMLRK